jgi:hypothetical protein
MHHSSPLKAHFLPTDSAGDPERLARHSSVHSVVWIDRTLNWRDCREGLSQHGSLRYSSNGSRFNGGTSPPTTLRPRTAWGSEGTLGIITELMVRNQS